MRNGWKWTCLAIVSLFVCTAAHAGTDKIDGIYKTPDLSMNAYVQTYEDDSVVILFTPNLKSWSPFLASSIADLTIQVDNDLYEQGHRLRMSFSSASEAVADLSYGGRQPDTFTFHKRFSAPYETIDLMPVDGIYKPEDFSITAYIQTFTTNSALYIFTPDLEEWHVFLDEMYNKNDSDGAIRVEDLQDKIDPDVYLEEMVSLFSASAASSEDPSFRATIRYANGTSKSWKLNRVFAAPGDECIMNRTPQVISVQIEGGTNQCVNEPVHVTARISDSDDDAVKVKFNFGNINRFAYVTPGLDTYKRSYSFPTPKTICGYVSVEDVCGSESEVTTATEWCVEVSSKCGGGPTPGPPTPPPPSPPSPPILN